ncbi:E3 ubiquitin-protein ligase TRIM39 [Perca flavescens]|uniref:E3 ubiquitin-protein ligase TRIM39 n=1 Tax=Perca flavescens TaxID=8167 RepID=UPI00106DEB52|nr:E3 ubiquitin-protein ligase TRIM39-like [Perca flavescens]
MSQTDTNNDSDMSLQVCDCGWSNVTTYNELKIHQTEMGCKPKGVKVDESKQDLKLVVYTPLNTDMASARPSPSETVSMETHLKCSICMCLFVDPVTTACGHSFCKECLDRNCEYNDRLCPLCKQILRRTPEVNIVLRSIAEQVKKTQEEDAKYTLAPGEVACDICTGRKLKAKKSCLVCLASYCSTHLENHSSTKRLKGHKLVEPVENLDERACLKHGRPLELYSRKKERCICVLCLEEDQEEVVPIEDEWVKKKAKLKNTKGELQEKIVKRKSWVDETSSSLQSCKDQLENEWWDIENVFTAVIAIVEEAHAAAHKPVQDRREVVEKEAKDIQLKLEAEINRLEKTISELDDIAALDDHILFLQSYPSLQDLNNLKDSTEVDLDTSLSFGTMRKTTTTMLEQIQQKLENLTSIELQRVPKFTVDVKLDPTTAHRRLILSDDGKEVKDEGEDQEVDDAPERYDLFASILGLNRLNSGKSYWEVEVSNKTGWDLGVARGDANRKGKLSLNPENGYWVTVHYEDDKYAALTAPPVRLSLKDKPKKVGVFVDYEEGLVSFYDVTAQSHIYSFTECSFSDEVFPYFSPHVKQDEKNTDPLIICVVKDCD